MRILYITTSLDKDDFVSFDKQWSISLNTSNQVFHNKMIRSFAINHPVDVISIRPFNRKSCQLRKLTSYSKQVGNIHYHYLAIPRWKTLQMSSIKKQVQEIVDVIKDDYIVVCDTINPKCLLIGTFIKDKYHKKVIGICTDSPKNITGVDNRYIKTILDNSQKLDGYISLTEGLNSLFNKDNKKNIVIGGIIEDETTATQSVSGQYFFFGGALLPRYGVYHLINAFKRIDNKDLSLLICGHHGDEEQLKQSIDDDNRIKYLGSIPVDEVLSLEQHSLANINPRPFSKELDIYSIPSKTLEYLASDSLTISMRNSELEKHFKDEIIWSNSDDEDGLYRAMIETIDMPKEKREKMIKTAKNTANSLYSIKNIAKLLDKLLSDILL